MSFDDYLQAKRIDAFAFKNGEPALYQKWAIEFSQMNVNSFTMQKLNLINPLRRKYLLGVAEQAKPTAHVSPDSSIAPQTPATVKSGKPIMRPKPKIN